MINQTTVNDFNAGKRDKRSGYYDKWYRYNRKDDGAAYDAGFSEEKFNEKVDGIQIIECTI